jgi:hypothetical protein
MPAPDLSAFQRAKSFSDFDREAIEEARQRAAQAQSLQIQRQNQEMLQKKFELEQQEFEADKAARGNGLFTGTSIQAQIGNQMRELGYTPQQIIQALTTQGIPLQDGGFATYSRVGTVGAPAGATQQVEQMQAPAQLPQQGAAGAPATVDNIQSILDAMPNTTGLSSAQQAARARSPGVNILVEPGMKITEQREMASNLSKTEQQATNALNVINALIDEQGNLRPETASSVGGIGGIQGRQAEAFPLTQNQRRTQPFIDQLKGQAFLTAFEQLKGGGQITEIEGRKATDAIIRLQQYQSEEDFAQALKDLRDIVQTGLNRARGINAEYNQPAEPMAAAPENVQAGSAELQPGTIQDGYAYMGGDPANPSSWQKVR